MDKYTYEEEWLKVEKYIKEKGLLLASYDKKEIQQLYLKECLEWDNKAKICEKTGHKQGQYSIDIERRTRILYDKLLLHPKHKSVSSNWFDEHMESSNPVVKLLNKDKTNALIASICKVVI